MKLFLKRCIPFLLAIGILVSIGWYLLVYDREFTRDVLISQARHFDSRGNSNFAAKLYDLAYDYTGQDEDVAIELANQYRKAGNYTKAEYTLTHAIADSGTVELYAALCKTFVEQDKLLDAVTMLDSIADPQVRAQMDQLRPEAPAPVADPGFYNEYINLDFPAADGKIYFTTNGEYPSTGDSPFSEPVALPGGETVIYALHVTDNGLVSPLTIAAYTISGVIEEAVFTDPAIELALRQQLSLEDGQILMTDMLWDIKEFTIPEGTQTLTDLKLLPYLETLTVPDLNLESLNFLSPLTHLKELDLTACRFPAAELTQVAGLPNLEKLVLSQCGLSTIADLSGAPSLRYLDLSSNTLRNLEPLIPMTTLEELYLQHNAVTTLDALTPLDALKKLDVSYNSVVTIAPLADCSSLQWLNAGNNSISDLTGMDTFPALTHLDLDHNQLSTITVLGSCSGLMELNLSNNNIRFVDSLGNLPQLTALNLAHNDVYKLPDFPADSPLRILDASHNHLDNIFPLYGLEELAYLYLDYNNLQSLDSVAECYMLVMVNAYGNKITDVSRLTARNIIVNYDPTSD